ncbi:MAG: fructose-1,6-bisphosphatase [Clostridiales bacterium]|nr:fructose-1,6-bisphosphatase [Clostridiales bacterium]
MNNSYEEKALSSTSTDRRVLELLAQSFPTAGAAATEIINLEAILNLPKGTEHFVADLHGEYQAFRHILRNASGNIRRKVRELYAGTLSDTEIRSLCTLIYYPHRKLDLIKEQHNGRDMTQFYVDTLHRLIEVCRSVSSKYTRSKVRKALPREFAYIIEELLHEDHDDNNKQAYFSRIIETIITTGQVGAFIAAISSVIQRLSIDQLHILGDIFDRGPGAHKIMDMLCDYSHYDMQWGNHDALWMGAAAGNECCIANVVRLSLRYGNMATLEDGYGINLVPLVTLAMEAYGDDPCDRFQVKFQDADMAPDEKTRMLLARMHKAIAVIQFKLEGAMIDKRPEWNMSDRRLLDKMNLDKGTITIDGKEYELGDRNFPTIDPHDPYRLSPEEANVVERLRHSFTVSEKLKQHVKCLFSHGCMYSIVNSNLLFHASVPLNADGTLKDVDLMGEKFSGRELLYRIGMMMRAAFNDDTEAEKRDFARDYFWYLWCGADSPLFDKSRMTTFERYFIDDKSTHVEEKGAYYTLRNNEAVCDYILDSFGVTGTHRHIINGHVPVRVGNGENPVRANGKLLVIDGGFSKPYHHTTGIAGFTLVYHSRGLELVEHEPFTSAEESVRKGTDILGTTQIVELSNHRQRVRDTDKGREIQAQIDELTQLLYAYNHGLLKERS